MSVMQLDAPCAKPSSAFDLLHKILLAISEGIEAASRYRVLRNMSNAELAELGLTRKDILRITLNGLDG